MERRQDKTVARFRKRFFQVERHAGWEEKGKKAKAQYMRFGGAWQAEIIIEGAPAGFC
jgi:hypothetical protein